jgi:two-component system invasion response regulator UvrY
MSARDRASASMTVLLVDDHAVVREGYRQLLARQRDIVVIGEAQDAAQALELFGRLEPQIVVMDISLPGISGIEAMRRMLAREGTTRVLIFSMHEEVIFARRAMQAGACGYVIKASAPSALVEAIRTIASGGKYLSPDLAQELAWRDVAPEMRACRSLSAREFEVLRLLVQGASIKDIARSLGLNPKTVANHQSAIKHKLGAPSALQLLQAANRLGLEPRRAN